MRRIDVQVQSRGNRGHITLPPLSSAVRTTSSMLFIVDGDDIESLGSTHTHSFISSMNSIHMIVDWTTV